MESLAEDLATMIRRPLTEGHVDLLRRAGRIEEIEPGSIVIRAGDAYEDFHFVLEGEFELYDPVKGCRIGSASLGAGQFMGDEALHSVTLQVRKTGTYRKLVFDGPKLAGCVLVGETDDALWYLDLIRRGVDVSPVRRHLIHGRDFAEAALGEPGFPKAA